MEADAAKTDRTKAKRLLTMSINGMEKAIHQNMSKSIVQEKFVAVNRYWQDVADRHALYITLAYPEDKDIPAAEDTWIENAEHSYNDSISKCDDYMKGFEGALQIQDETKKRSNLLKYELASLKTLIATVNSLITDVDSSQDAIEEAKGEMRRQLEKYDSAQREYILCLTEDTDVEAELRLAEKMKTDCMNASIAASKLLESKTLKRVEETGNKFMELKLERMKMPTFSGNIRDYPRFKADFKKHVIPYIKNPDTVAYVLKSCLSNAALEIVKNVDDDIDDMWKRLDEKYGRISKLTDAIMLELKQLRVLQEGDGQKFINFVDKIEKCYRDLSIIGKESEISNSSIVGLIEEKLPTSIKKQWCLQISNEDVDLDGEDKFAAILSFLLKHRKATEYDSSELRSTSSRQGTSTNVLHMSDESCIGSEDSTISTIVTMESKPCWLHGRSSQHSILDCQRYMSKTPQERMTLATRHRVCWCCLGTGHNQARCNKRKVCGIEGCTKCHHPTLHSSEENAEVTSASTISTTQNSSEGIDESLQQHHVDNTDSSGKKYCLLQLMRIRYGQSPTTSMNVMWDSGATISMITFKKAHELGLSGSRARINIVKVGGKRESIESKIYDVPLYDLNNKLEIFKAYGIEQISSAIRSTNMNEVADLLNTDVEKIGRPTGEIDMLIGFEYAGFHPQKIHSSDHLLLLRNKFGCCVGGSHTSLEEKTNLLIQEAEVCHAYASITDFYESESLGVMCVPKCGGCKCGECAVGGKQYTIQEERELAIIEQGLSLSNNRWTAKYPWKKDPKDLPNNYPAAFAMLRSTEKRLLKDDNQAKLYSEQIEDMVERGVAKKITMEEEMNYNGPIYYVSHHEVVKPESQSTPCRIVFNSSASYMGHNLNDYWFKGPDLLNNLLGILLRFRQDNVAFAGDIKKMYHSVGTSELDHHTHRFLWRNLEVDRKPDIYTITAVSFGDKPAGAIASLALRKTAEIGENEYPEASSLIKKNTYMDDVIGSRESVPEMKRITCDVEVILNEGGFQIKEWITSYSHESMVSLDQVGCDRDVSKVLGVVWDTRRDELRFRVRLNFSEKKRKVRIGEDMTVDSIKVEFPKVITRRILLSQVNGIYDPIGLASPFIVRAKLLLRDLTAAKVGWDEPLSEEDRLKWYGFFNELFKMNNIIFPRSAKPKDAQGKPSLVIFSDASKLAFGACAYLRWMIEEGTFISRLLMAKSKLAPTKELTMPRLELNGALLSARMKHFIEKEMTIEFSGLYLIVDSEIVRAMIQKESYGFNTFVAVRVGEIQNHTNKNDWYWVESCDNVADIITRGTGPEELDTDSIWQSGPGFLRQPAEFWPVKQSFSGGDLPEQEKSVQVNVVEEAPPIMSAVIDCQRYSSYDKLIRITARVQSVFKEKPRKSLKNVSQVLKRDDIHEAERSWILTSQAELTTQLKPETLKRLCARKDNGIVVAGTRLESWENLTYEGQPPILLSAKCHLAKLYARKIHESCHLGISSVIAKIRRKFWIVGLRRLVKSLRFNCTTCKKLDGKLQQQVMGKIPIERLKPAPAWSYSSVDLFGPFEIKGETNKRSRSKGYGVLFNCMLSRAVYVDLSPDYSTDSFLLVIRRFMAVKGCPIKIWSDRGSQIVAANKELKQALLNLDEEAINNFSSANSFDWEFSAPDAPWQNGCAEALIKSVKKAISIAIGSQALSFSEMLTVLYEAAELVNERPIGKHPTSVEEGTYLAPNDLQLGRSSSKIPHEEYSMSTKLSVRYHFVQQIISAFWKKWTVNFFPSLLVRQKWHTSHRNVMVGDVVLVQDTKQRKGDWKLGRVVRADPSLRDGFVRNVDIQHKNPGLTSLTTITRPVQRVIVMVPVNGDDDNEDTSNAEIQK